MTADAEALIARHEGRAASPPALQLSRLSKSFGGQKALDNAALTVAAGEVHGLIGQNGSGKSTLIKILGGFHAPDPGSRLALCGEDVPLPLAPGAFRRHRISFVHQHLGLVPSLSVLENLMVGRLAQRHDWAIDWRGERRRALRRFADFGIGLDPGSRVADLTPVERALLAILRAVSEIEGAESRDGEGTGLLVLDEPTPFLPKADVTQLFLLVRRIVARGASVIFVSHDIDEVMEITDRATVLRDGRVAATLETATAKKSDFIAAIVGRRLSAIPAPTAPAATKARRHAVVRGLDGGVVQGFALETAAGEVVGLTGLIGSGYDEIPYLLYGARAAVAGTLDFAGHAIDLSALTPRAAIACGIVLIPADRGHAGVIGPLPVSDNVTMPVLGASRRRWLLNRGSLVARATALGRRFEVRPADATLPITALSGGNQQKVVLAKWFQTAPKLILLDEPTQGVDVGARQTVFRHIAEAAAAGATVLCASSDYEQLAAIASRVLIFAGGRVVASLNGTEITRDAIAERSLGDAGQKGSRPLSRDSSGEAGSPARPAGGLNRLVRRAEQFGLLAVWLALIAVFGVLRPDTFLTWPNLSTILGSQAVLVVVTLGLIIPLTANDFDLSIAFVMTLSSMVVAVLNVNYGIGIGWAILAALASGAVVGLINGLLITVFRIHSLIVTLGTGTFIHGFTLWMSDSMTISGISPSLMNAVIVDRLFGIPLEFYYSAGLAALLWYLLDYTALGRRIMFVGRGREVARLSGIDTDKIRLACLVLSSLFGALAGVLYAGTQGAADPVSGASYQLPAFAAAFLGSTSIAPGRFNPWGATVAVYFLVTGITGLVFLGFSSFIQEMFYGGALVVAVCLSQLVRGRQEQQF